MTLARYLSHSLHWSFVLPDAESGLSSNIRYLATVYGIVSTIEGGGGGANYCTARIFT